MEECRFLALFLVPIMVSFHATGAVILRPNWFPYFKNEESLASLLRGARALPNDVMCPRETNDLDCYNLLITAWARLSQRNKDSGTHGGKLFTAA